MSKTNIQLRETDAEVGFALEILGKANLISYEEAAGQFSFQREI